MPFSSNPSTPSTGGKSILLADLESGEHKATKISINSMEESPSERPVLGRRRTTHSAPESDANIAALVEEEDALTKVGNYIWKIHSANVFTRYTLYIFPVAALLAVPLALTATIYKHAEA